MLGKGPGGEQPFGGWSFPLSLIMGVFMFFMRWTIIVMSRLMEYDIRKEIYDAINC